MNIKSYAAKTDQGPYLQHNEDDLAVDLINNFFLVADGFGGHGVGDKATELVKSKIMLFFNKIGSDPDSTLPFYFSAKHLLESNALVNAFMSAHEVLKKEQSSKEMDKRGGCSVMAAALSEHLLSIVSTGNCLGILLRRGDIHPLVIPDSREKYSRDSLFRHFYTCPMSGFGLFDDLHYQVIESKVFAGDTFLFLTDGVYSRLNLKEIRQKLDKNIPDLEKIDELFNLANDRGNSDNQTALILNF